MRYKLTLDRGNYECSLFSLRVLTKPFNRNSGRRLQAHAVLFILLILHQTIHIHASAKSANFPDRQAQSGCAARGGSSLEGYDSSCQTECPVDMLNLLQLQKRLLERWTPGLGVELNVQGIMLERRN
ncbi:hypothetical protein Vretifemale_222, partial [Volvox reticuliferus]